MEILKKEDRRNIKPKFIGTKEEKAKGQGRVVMINIAESSLDIQKKENFYVATVQVTRATTQEK